jgi:hypothetical protein
MSVLLEWCWHAKKRGELRGVSGIRSARAQAAISGVRHRMERVAAGAIAQAMSHAHTVCRRSESRLQGESPDVRSDGS